MSERWKGVERAVAKRLTQMFSDVGMSPVERIPILGRTGPDITINESRLVIDVKSRQVIPLRLFAPEKTVLRYDGGLLGFRLGDLLTFGNIENVQPVKGWDVLTSWHGWMDAWTKPNEPDGISCIIIHKPGMSTDRATIIINQSQSRRLIWQLTIQHQIALRLDQAAFRSVTTPA